MDAARTHNGLIANPNCSTIQMMVALKPLYDTAGIKRIVVSTYQSVSGKSGRAVLELVQQTTEALEGNRSPWINSHTRWHSMSHSIGPS